jgi:2-dehydro-3-deoxygluconokinase
MSRYDLVTFGEGQLRLTVPDGSRLGNTTALKVCAAGSEANVAGLLAQRERACAWATVLPRGDLGDRVLLEYRSVGVDLSHVRRTETGRVAVYYLEPAASGLPARVRYDRLHTAFRSVKVTDFDWETLLDTRLMFVSGITAALSPETAALTKHAIDAALGREVPVALDVNHRSTLWSDDEAREALEPALGEVDVLLCSIRDAERVFGAVGNPTDVAARLADRTSARHVICTDGFRGVHYDGIDGPESFPVTRVPIADRPGAGDALVAGVLDGYLDGDVKDGVRRGQRFAAIALTHFGDLTHLGPDDLAVTAGDDIVR